MAFTITVKRKGNAVINLPSGILRPLRFSGHGKRSRLPTGSISPSAFTPSHPPALRKGIPSQFLQIPQQVRPDRVQVNVAHQSQQVDIFLAQDEFKAVLGNTAPLSMPLTMT
jgi:hypothetical protein